MWILYINRKYSAKRLDTDKAPQYFPKPKLHQKKLMATVSWSSAGLIHISFIKPGETITAEKYCRKIYEMHQNFTRKQPALANRKGPILLHDNARPHVSMTSRQKLHTFNYDVLDLPPYSRDIYPTDFYFFKHLVNFLQ